MDNANQDNRGQLEKMLRPRPQVRAFAEYMERVLRQNDHKDGWGSISLDALFRHSQKQLDDLRDAITKRDRNVILKEAADVSNFMMMISMNTATCLAIDDVMGKKNETLIPSHRQLSIAFGKHLAGYAPGENGWCGLDDEALHYAHFGDETTPLPFDDDGKEENS